MTTLTVTVYDSLDRAYEIDLLNRACGPSRSIDWIRDAQTGEYLHVAELAALVGDVGFAIDQALPRLEIGEAE